MVGGPLVSLFFRSESRAISPQAFDNFLSGDDTVSLSIGDKALRLTPVYSAVALLADSVASLPVHAYRQRGDGTRERLPGYPLLSEPAAVGTVYDWLHRAMVSLLLRGNAYGLVTARNREGWPVSVEWLNPVDVTVDESTALPCYYVKGREIPAAQLLHLVAFARPGKATGLSPIQSFALTIDLGLDAQKAARDWYRNGTRPSQSLKNTARTLDSAQSKVVRERFKATAGNGDVFVHGSDWELSQVGVSAQDAQFLDAIKATATQVAAIYRIPPEKIGGETGSSLTYATVEQQSIDFLTHSLRPWLVRVEQALSAQMPRGTYAKFNADAMIRTDLLTRYQAHEIALRTGLETLDEGRLLEDKAPLTDAEKSAWLAAYKPTLQPPKPDAARSRADDEKGA